MRDSVLAIDQGTSGTKAVVVDPSDGVVAEARSRCARGICPDGGVEQDPAALWTRCSTAGRHALADAGRPVGAGGAGQSGRDRPGVGPRDRPAAVGGDRVAGPPRGRVVRGARRSRGTARGPDRPGARPVLLGAQDGVAAPPHHHRAGWSRTTDAWLVHQLAGEFVTDASTASRSLVLDVDRVGWDAELLGLFGLAEEPLPRIVGCDERVGTTTAFGQEIAVGGLVVDQAAALLAQGCLNPGEAKCTFGTGVFLLANTGSRAVRSTAGLTSVGGVARARADRVLRRRSGLHRGVSGALADRDGIHHRAQRSGHVRRHRSPRGCSASRRSPGWPPRGGAQTRLAPFTGITLSTRPEHLVVALLQGIAAQVAELTDVITPDLGQPLTVLRVDGGLTRSRLLMQAVADLTQLPVGALPIAARHRARCSRAWPPGRRPHAHARPSRSGMDAGRDLRAIMDCRSRKRVSRALARRRDRQPHDPGPAVTTTATQSPSTDQPTGEVYDVAVIGAGIVGSAIARELGGHQLSVALLEARDDVGDGTSKANTALLHTGYRRHPRHAGVPARPSRLRPAERLRRSTGIPSNAPARCSSPGTKKSSTRSPPCRTRPARTATTTALIIDAAEVYRQLPAPRARCARRAHRPRRVDHLHLDRDPRAGHRRPPARYPPVAGPRRRPRRGHRAGHHAAHRSRRTVRARFVVNAAGLGADTIDAAVRPPAVHGHPSARGAARVRQARPAAGQPDRARRADQAGQGRAHQPHDLRQRDARPDRRGPRRQDRHRHLRGRYRVPARQGPHPDAPPAGRGGHRDLRRPAGHHRSRRLPASRPTSHSATCSSAASAPPG